MSMAEPSISMARPESGRRPARDPVACTPAPRRVAHQEGSCVGRRLATVEQQCRHTCCDRGGWCVRRGLVAPVQHDESPLNPQRPTVGPQLRIECIDIRWQQRQQRDEAESFCKPGEVQHPELYGVVAVAHCRSGARRTKTGSDSLIGCLYATGCRLIHSPRRRPAEGHQRRCRGSQLLSWPPIVRGAAVGGTDDCLRRGMSASPPRCRIPP